MTYIHLFILVIHLAFLSPPPPIAFGFNLFTSIQIVYWLELMIRQGYEIIILLYFNFVITVDVWICIV